MKPGLRWGAIALLLLIAAPFVLGGTRNPLLIAPVWWVISYFALKRLFPADKRDLAAPIAPVVGLLAFEVLLIVHNPAGVPSYVHAAALVAGIVWLFAADSRIAAGLLMLLETCAGVLTIYVAAVQSAAGVDEVWNLAGVLTVQRIATLYLLAEVVWRPKPTPDAAAVFD